jgi:hypothetical protein
MKGCLHVAARAAAVLLAAVFAVTLPLSLVAFNLGRVAFSPERMTELLLETIEETGGLRQLVLETLASDSGADEDQGLGLSEALSFLTPQEREYLGDQLTPPGWASKQLGALVAGVYTWIDDDRARPSFVVDVTDLKVALLSGRASELVETVVDSWPPCSVEEIAEMTVGSLLGEESLRFCEPPEPLRSGVVGLLDASITLSLRALPDRISLGKADNPPASPEVMQTKEDLRRVRFLAGWSWLLSLVMLGLVMALVIRSWREMGLWWGIPLIVGALLTLATMVAVRVGVEGLAQRALSDASLLPWIGEMIHTLLTAMLVVVFRRVALHAAILAGIGTVMLVAGLRVRRFAPPTVATADASTLRLAAGDGDRMEEDEPPDPRGTPSGMFG